MKLKVKEKDIVSIKNVEYLHGFGIKVGDVFVVVRVPPEHPTVVLIRSLLDTHPNLPAGNDGIRGVWALASELKKLRSDAYEFYCSHRQQV